MLKLFLSADMKGKKHFWFMFQFDGFIDLDAYDTIAMKIKGDGRCYISTVCSQPVISEHLMSSQYGSA
jgi:hypothetical protein